MTEFTEIFLKNIISLYVRVYKSNTDINTLYAEIWSTFDDINRDLSRLNTHLMTITK